MNKKTGLILGVLMLVLGTVLMTIPLVQTLPAVKEVAALSIMDRLGLAGRFEQELKPGEYITVVDEKSGAIVDKTSRVVYTGDEIISESNDIYRITRVRGNRAFAKSLGKATGIAYKPEWDLVPAGAGIEPVQAGGRTIGIYHTHSDESYVPTDGSSAIPAKGGIFKVGGAFADQLKANGVGVLDDKTPHEPHDSNAYHRSRRTAARLMKKRPAALLDIHRDGVPDPNFYNKKLEGKNATKVRLVVGRQNPNMKTNLQFAKDIKAYMDKNKPGLIKGIFIGRGDYNQDLSPRALLLEVGTHTNSRMRAEQGAAVFADALPGFLNIKTAEAGGRDAGLPDIGDIGGAKSAWSTIAWIIGIILVAGAAFLFISTGSIKGVKSKLGELGKTEFNNFFGLKKTNHKRERKKKD